MSKLYPLYFRISFCTADKNHDKVFAFIARNTINETMECHAYYCAKKKIVSFRGPDTEDQGPVFKTLLA